MKKKLRIFCIAVGISCVVLLLIGAGLKKFSLSKLDAENIAKPETLGTEANTAVQLKNTILELSPSNLKGGTAVFSDISDSELKMQLDHKKDILNSVELSPTKTNHPLLDNLIEQRFSTNLQALPDTFSKAKFCYDWLLQNSNFGGGTVNMQDMYVFLGDCDYCGTDGAVVYDAYRMLLTGQGVCDNYASALTVLFRYIGLDAFAVHGKVQLANESLTNHVWVAVQINDTFYWFDPQVEAAATANGCCVYALFCADAENLPFYRTYDLAESCAAYHGFSLCRPLQVIFTAVGKTSEAFVYHPGEVNAYGDVVATMPLYFEVIDKTVPIELEICGGTAPYQCSIQSDYIQDGQRETVAVLENTQTNGKISTRWSPPPNAEIDSMVIRICDSEGRNLVCVLT
ncbi:MAG: transglutaminase domain-containing protein [Candidatus Fimenecus sp.]